MPIANVPSELQCQWLGEFYYHHALDSFRDAFSTAELALLAEFNAFFRKSIPLLPKAPDSIEVWLDDPTWQRIMAKAKETLHRWHKLNPCRTTNDFTSHHTLK